MKKFTVIFNKEIMGVISDKRAVISMIILPLVVFPIILNLQSRFITQQNRNVQEKELNVGIFGKENGQALVQILENIKDIRLSYFKDISQAEDLIKSGDIDGALLIESNFDSLVNGLSTGTLTLYYKSKNGGVKDRLMQILDIYKTSLTKERMARLNLNYESIAPLEINIKDISTKREIIGNVIGGIIPYLFVLFAFSGCIYPAIDFFTNEKEKGILETLLTTPTNRFEILFAKISVVAILGFFSALLAIIGIYFSMHSFNNYFSQDMTQSLSGILKLGNIVMMLFLMLPLTVFFASFLSMITTYAKSFKEAQALISPLTFVIIFIAFIGLAPGVTFNVGTALIPIANVSLASKEIISGTINPYLYILVMVSLLIYATIGVFIASSWFSKESNLVM